MHVRSTTACWGDREWWHRRLPSAGIITPRSSCEHELGSFAVPATRPLLPLSAHLPETPPDCGLTTAVAGSGTSNLPRTTLGQFQPPFSLASCESRRGR